MTQKTTTHPEANASAAEEALKQELCKALRHNLRLCILPYWMENMADNEGGFYGRCDANNALHPDAPRGAILYGRLLWTFAAAYRTEGRPEYLDMALRAYNYLRLHFVDNDCGGIYWSVTAEGKPLDTKKQFYAIGFAIYGLSELVRATGHAEALLLAQRLFACIEAHSRDCEKGGYIEATTREWQCIDDMRLSEKDANERKTMNTHLHIMEGYTNLYRVWPDESLREALTHLLGIFMDTITDGATHHLGLFFDDDWQRHDGIVSYGHDIEASWLLLETAQVLDATRPDPSTPAFVPEVLAHTHRIAVAAMEGLLPDGSMAYERHADGSLDAERHWWVQAETVVGLTYLWRHHGVAEALPLAAKCWNYISEKLIDPAGEWYWSRMPDGSVNTKDDKAGFWKCPYHNSRMCMEVMRLLDGAHSIQ